MSSQFILCHIHNSNYICFLFSPVQISHCTSANHVTAHAIVYILHEHAHFLVSLDIIDDGATEGSTVSKQVAV